jgi:hypothetical protein
VRQQLDGLNDRLTFDHPLCQRENVYSNDHDDKNSESSDANTSGNSTMRNEGANDNDPSKCDGNYEGASVYDEMDDHPSAIESTEIASLLPRILQTKNKNADTTYKSGRHVSTASTAVPTGISTIIVDAAKRAAPASDQEFILQSQGQQNKQQHTEH